MIIGIGRRGLIVALTLVAGCDGSGKSKGAPAAPLPTLAEQAPVVADPARLASAELRVPPVVVTIAADGALAVADAPRTPDPWTELSTKAPRSKGHSLDLASIGPLIHEAAVDRRPIEAVLADRKAQLPPLPPPPPDDLESDPLPPLDDDDLEEDDDATGVAMALDEGKMGKVADPAVRAREEAIAVAHSVGFLAELDPNRDPAMPTRASQIVGRAVDVAAGPRALIVAAPTARAIALVDAVAAIGPSLIAVSHQRTLRALRVGFQLDRASATPPPDDDRWIEVRVGADALTIEVVPGPTVTVPWAPGPLDAAALGKAYAAAQAAFGDAQSRSVDLLVGPDTDVQRAVDAIAALDGAGALAISLGRAPAPDSPEAAKRGKRIPRVAHGAVQSVGDLDRRGIRSVIVERSPQIKACYERALRTTPDLAGTVSAQFFIAPNGTVTSSTASGVAPELASCVASVIKSIEFPKPKGGGRVQVNYPFTFRE